MGHSVRKSRSIIGLPFEDQIAALNKSASIQDKLLQIVNISWNTAARLVHQEYDNQDSTGDNPQADLVVHVRNSLAGKPLIKAETLTHVKSCVDDMARECEKKTPQRIIPPRLKKLNEALERATKEAEDWRQIHHSRKNSYNMARLEKRQVQSGEKIVSNKDREKLPTSEDAWLRGLSDGHDEWNKVQDQEKALAIAQKGLILQVAQKRKALSDLQAEIDVVALKIQKYSEQLNTAEALNDVEMLTPPKNADFTLS